MDDGIGSTSGSGTVGLRAGAAPGDGGCPYGITSPGVVGQGTGSLLSSAVAARAHERANANTTIPIPMLRFQRARNSSAEGSGRYERPRWPLVSPGQRPPGSPRAFSHSPNSS